MANVAGLGAFREHNTVEHLFAAGYTFGIAAECIFDEVNDRASVRDIVGQVALCDIPNLLDNCMPTFEILWLTNLFWSGSN